MVSLLNALLIIGTPFLVNPDWAFLPAELRHLRAGEFWGEAAVHASQSRRPEAADPLPAILDFHQSLAAEGVQLLLVPVPPKALMLPLQAGLSEEESSRAHAVYDGFFNLLKEAGVAVLDLRESFAEAPESFFLRTDTHWSPEGIALAARLIGNRIGEEIPATKQTGARQTSTVYLRGDLSQPDDPKERVDITRFDPASEGHSLADPHAPLLLLGDSHVLVFHAGGDLHTTGGGLPEHLAAELGSSLDVIGVRGSGATPARLNLFRRAQSVSDYWESKTWVIWVFAGRELTESEGWRVLPIRR